MLFRFTTFSNKSSSPPQDCSVTRIGEELGTFTVLRVVGDRFACSLIKFPSIQSYAMTETAVAGTYLLYKDYIFAEKSIESVGKEMMNMEIGVVNENDEDMAPGIVGRFY